MDNTDKPADSSKDTLGPDNPEPTPPAQPQQQWVVVGAPNSEYDVMTSIKAEQLPSSHRILFGPTNHREQALCAYVLATKGRLPIQSPEGGKSREPVDPNVTDKNLEQSHPAARHAIENSVQSSRGRDEMIPSHPSPHSMFPRPFPPNNGSGTLVRPNYPLPLPVSNAVSRLSGQQYPRMLWQPYRHARLPSVQTLLQMLPFHPRDTQSRSWAAPRRYLINTLEAFHSPVLPPPIAYPPVSIPAKYPTRRFTRQAQHFRRSSQLQVMSQNTKIAGSRTWVSQRGELTSARAEKSREGKRPVRQPGPSRLRYAVTVSSTGSDKSSKSPKRIDEQDSGEPVDYRQDKSTKKG